MKNKPIITQFSFESGSYDALVCLNADLPGPDFFRYFDESKVLAADGAAIKLREKGIFPAKVIGDLDSFYESPRSSEFPQKKIMHIPDQESNDFEKILSFCIDSGLSHILITGLHGGVLEHTLNNWSVLIRYAKKLNLCIYDKGRYGVPVRDSFSVNVDEGEIISLIPQPEVKLSTKGLKWELNCEWLKLGNREGARNLSLKENLEITIHEGEMLLFIDSRLPYPLRKKQI